jgi:transglutaminase superfamily protein
MSVPLGRRAFLALASAVFVRPDVRAQSSDADSSQTFEIATHVHVQHASGITRVWLPTPLAVAPYQNTMGDTYNVEDGTVTMIEREGLDLLAAEWRDGAEPIVTLSSRVATKPRHVDFSTPTVPPPKDLSAFGPYTRAPKLAPPDAAAIADRAAVLGKQGGTDLDRARAIFEWVVAPGQSALNDPPAAYVAIARAAGLPARAVYGLTLAARDATRAQASRVEVYLVGYGWVPVDLRTRQFGAWDRTWVAFNSEQDLVLPGATRGSLPYFMHPQAETAGRRVDSLDPDSFRYTITVERG